jgi:hypothetical protein
MKQLLLAGVLLLILENIYAQEEDLHGVPPFTLAANKIVYTGSITLDPNISKEILFYNARQWYKHNFESADNTLTTIKADSGKISGTGIIHIRRREKHAEPYDIYFTIDIIVTNGAYQYKVYDIYSFENKQKFFYSDMYKEEQYPTPKPRWPKPYREAMLNKMNDKVLGMIAGLQRYMR